MKLSQKNPIVILIKIAILCSKAFTINHRIDDIENLTTEKRRSSAFRKYISEPELHQVQRNAEPSVCPNPNTGLRRDQSFDLGITGNLKGDHSQQENYLSDRTPKRPHIDLSKFPPADISRAKIIKLSSQLSSLPSFDDRSANYIPCVGHQTEMLTQANQGITPHRATILKLDLHVAQKWRSPSDVDSQTLAWPKLVFNTDTLSVSSQISPPIQQMAFNLKKLPKDINGSLLIGEENVIQFAGTYNKKKASLGKSVQIDPDEQERLSYQRKQFNLLTESHGCEIWFGYLLQKTKINFQSEITNIKTIQFRELFPYYLFYVHIIDEIIPRSKRVEDELNYSSAMSSAKDSYLKLEKALHIGRAPASSQAHFVGLVVKFQKMKKTGVQDDKQTNIWLFLHFWMYTSRKPLFNKLEGAHPVKYNNFKSLINAIFSISVGNHIEVLSKQIPPLV